MSYHITARGEPGICKAQKGNCPLGGANEHFETAEEARESFESKQGNSFGQPSRFVQAETEFLITSVNVESLKEGDYYEASPITSISVGSKWVTIATEAKPKYLVAKGEKVAVQREVKTAETREKEKKEYIERAVERNFNRAQQSFESAKTAVNEQLEKEGGIDGFRLTHLLETQATKQIWDRVARRAESQNETLAESAKAVKEHYLKSITEYALKTGLSRSTAQASNLIEDANNEAILKFLRDDDMFF